MCVCLSVSDQWLSCRCTHAHERFGEEMLPQNDWKAFVASPWTAPPELRRRDDEDEREDRTERESSLLLSICCVSRSAIPLTSLTPTPLLSQVETPNEKRKNLLNELPSTRVPCYLSFLIKLKVRRQKSTFQWWVQFLYVLKSPLWTLIPK